jgi:hypothetical protein
MIRRSLWRALAEAERAHRSRAAPPAPPGLDAAGVALWREMVDNMNALPPGPLRDREQTVLEVLDAQIITLMAKMRG